jgi:hypothetical protein
LVCSTLLAITKNQLKGKQTNAPRNDYYSALLRICKVDDKLGSVNRPPLAKLHQSCIVTIGLLFALKGGHFRAFYRWLSGDWRSLFPNLPDRTRLLRLLATYSRLTEQFLAEPSEFNVIDSYGIELIHPIREGRSQAQIGAKGKSNRRWIVGIKMGWLVNFSGRVVNWGWDSANVPAPYFRDIAEYALDDLQVLADNGFRLQGRQADNWTICGRGERNERMIIERIFSLLTVVNQLKLKHVFHRTEPYLQGRLAYTAAMFNTLLELAEGKLAIAQFSL